MKLAGLSVGNKMLRSCVDEILNSVKNTYKPAKTFRLSTLNDPKKLN